MRTGRTNFSPNSFLDSFLVEYTDIKTARIEELIKEYNDVPAPIVFEIKKENESFEQYLSLKRDTNYPKSYSLASASSGQKKAVALTTLKYVWKDSVFKPIVLLDEPENSMHPGLTSKMFSSLNELTKLQPQPSFIIATHLLKSLQLIQKILTESLRKEVLLSLKR